jgi:sulfide:quinone oxidoreductase
MAPLRVLVAGGGVAGLEAVLALRHLAGAAVETTLLTPGPDYVARPLSVRTPFEGPAAPRMAVERVGVPLHRGALARVDADRHEAHTSDGSVLVYDRLVVAVGARAQQSLPGALHFHGPRSAGLVEGTLRDAPREPGRPVALVVAPGVSWALPLYELALAAAAADREICLITDERRPLERFGPHPSDAVARLLDRAGVEVRTARAARGVFDGALLLEPGGLLPVAATIARPALSGPGIEGLPADEDGFVPVDAAGRVRGVDDVLAAGDATDGPVKQGGLAAQQADAVAATIASTDPPGEPVLRAMLMTADQPLYLRTPLARPEAGVASSTPLWQPEGKVAARHLTGFLAGEPDRLLEDLAARGLGRVERTP